MMSWAKNKDLVFAAGVIAVVAIVFVPLPTALMDGALVVSIALSLLTLMAVVYAKEPLEFSVFPSLLLLTTAFRLALNVATTRLILTNAKTEGTQAAGSVIRSFGEFVAGSEPTVGFVIFLILIIVNFVVISRGATRIGEVAARFTLDAMPGKQMAIDAELNAGLIAADEAKRRRERVTREAEFYGAMDGATKFVQGDAIAGLLITAVNIIGGLILGIAKYGMSATKAMSTFTILTIGDGLVAALPALLVSIAAGLMVTKASSDSSLGHEVIRQLFLSERRSLYVAGSVLGMLALTALIGSGMPVVPLVVVGGLLVALGRMLLRAGERAKREEAARTVVERPQPTLETMLHVEPLELELGIRLVRFGSELMERVGAIRRELALELGMVVPSVVIREGEELESTHYVIKMRGVRVASGSVSAGEWEAIIAYLRKVVRERAAELLTRDDVSVLLKSLREKRPAVVDEVVPALVKPGELQRVLQNLLREGVSIRDLGTILEKVGDVASRTKEIDTLTEEVRQALGRQITQKYVKAGEKLHVVMFDARVEDMIRSATARSEILDRMRERMAREVDRIVLAGHPPVILCSSAVRLAVKRLADSIRPGIAVLSHDEIAREVQVVTSGVVGVEEPRADVRQG